MVRTIHQAKGAESPAVFVVLDGDQADHILNPAQNDEEQRITYVALSRAQDELFIYCPDSTRRQAFEALGASVLEVGSPSEEPASRTRRRKR
jgi:superfamily I DNA/RNA helicase